jgi:hypothetical protein
MTDNKTPAPETHVHVAIPELSGIELAGVADQLEEGAGAWRACSGIHELIEGHPTGPWSETLKSYMGGGCRECGGIGAIWDNTDYSQVNNSLPLKRSEEADLPVLSEASLPTTSRLSQLEARKSCAASVNDPLRLDVTVSLDAEDGFKRELMNQLTRFVHDLEDLSVDDVAVQDLFAQHLSGRQNGFLIGKIIAEKLGSFGILTESTVFSDMEVVAGHDADSVFNRTSVHAVSSTRGHPNERLEPDYCFNPDDWEFTCDWTDRDQVHGHGDALNRSDPMRVCTLMKGPDKWVADVPVTWDENGDPEDTEVKWFDSEAEARVALTATTEGLDNA